MKQIKRCKVESDPRSGDGGGRLLALAMSPSDASSIAKMLGGMYCNDAGFSHVRGERLTTDPGGVTCPWCRRILRTRAGRRAYPRGAWRVPGWRAPVSVTC